MIKSAVLITLAWSISTSFVDPLCASYFLFGGKFEQFFEKIDLRLEIKMIFYADCHCALQNIFDADQNRFYTDFKNKSGKP